MAAHAPMLSVIVILNDMPVSVASTLSGHPRQGRDAARLSAADGRGQLSPAKPRAPMPRPHGRPDGPGRLLVAAPPRL